MGLTRMNQGLRGELIIEPKDLISSPSTTPTTVDDAIAVQKSQSILVKPVETSSSTTTATLSVGLCNSTTSSTVYAYITGLAVNNDNAVCLIESDGVTVHYPSNPTTIGNALTANCAIPLGAPGTTKWCTIPQIAGGRIWFCIESTLTFLLNPGATGAGLVEPSVSNTADPNYYKTWDFCEFTYNTEQLFANITYVDFVSVPIALTLTNSSGVETHVAGMASNGLNTVCTNLIAQNAKDGAGWDQLIIKNTDGSYLRAVSPLNGINFNSTLFSNYFTSYINLVWAKYATSSLTVDTQASWGTVTGTTFSGNLTFGDIGSFGQPSATDIFSGDTGIFQPAADNTQQLLAIGARLDAAFNRTTLLSDSVQPDNDDVSAYYTNDVTNHYARIVHAANLDGKGYCFPYDDVAPSSGIDQSGEVNDPNPTSLLITIGGGNAYSKMRMRRGLEVEEAVSTQSQLPMKHMQAKRSVSWAADVKDQITLSPEEKERDLELGEHPKLLAEFDREESPSRSTLPLILDRLFGGYLPKLQTLAYAHRLRPFIDILNTFLVFLLSQSVRAIFLRAILFVLFLVFYLVGGKGMASSIQQEPQQMYLVNTTLVGGSGLDRRQGS